MVVTWNLKFETNTRKYCSFALSHEIYRKRVKAWQN